MRRTLKKRIAAGLAAVFFLFQSCAFTSYAEEPNDIQQTAVEESVQTPGVVFFELLEYDPFEFDIPEEPSEEQEDFENELIEAAILEHANVKHDVKLTYYCTENYKHICNDGDATRTASGMPPIPWLTCAADDIPLGSTVMLDYDDDGVVDQYLVCNDRFGGGRKNAIDICVETHQEALNCGIRHATVYWEPPAVVG